MPTESTYCHVAGPGVPVIRIEVEWQPECVTIALDGILPGDLGADSLGRPSATDLDSLIGVLQEARRGAFGDSYTDLCQRYGHPEKADRAIVLEATGHANADTQWAFAHRYPSAEACRAFAAWHETNGGESIGPVTIDGWVYGVTLFAPYPLPSAAPVPRQVTR